MSDATQIRDQVRDRYAEAARNVDASCCSTNDCCSAEADVSESSGMRDFGNSLYQADQLAEIPSGAALASLGCGNPTAVAELRPGETVLDLGSGAGIDVLLSAKRVGPDGFAYGLDMTDEMLELARKHQSEAGTTNVEFLKGVIEEIPLPDSTVDVIISNCVINLSTDKSSVFTEMFRVLRPGGRLGIADVVADNHLSATDRRERGSWVGCTAGALSFDEYRSGLVNAGFENVSIRPSHKPVDGINAAIIRAAKP